ncbi:MAG TPA: hypothetical protein VN729_09310 [Ktedonobacteraceae bacterium]|nr:hypothetical protein [Ktedonobacteraceae bacterium]
MRCTNCGLPLSPSRTTTNCPRCGAPLNALQGAQQQQQPEQSGWEGGMGGASPQPQQSLWGQGNTPVPGSYSPFPQPNQGGLNANRMGGFGDAPQQSPLSPRRPYSPQQNSKITPKLMFIVAGLFVVLAALLLGLVFILGSANSGNTSPNTASTNTNTAGSHATATTASATPTDASTTPDANASPTASGTAYPGQKYIDGAQMAMGINKQTLQATNPTTTFKAGSEMYVVFNLHPPSQGGAVCSYWYLAGKQVTSYPFAVKAGSHASYTFATYGSAGQAYVELYWASTKSCSDQVLAQHIEFTVTA